MGSPVRVARSFTSRKGGEAVVTYSDMFTFTLVLIGLASLIVSITKKK